VIDAKTMSAILDSLHEPVLFVGLDHVILYANKAALDKYAKWGDIVGRSLLDCHNERSREVIREVLAAFEQGENERLISENETRRVYMTAVRDEAGALIGYSERCEPVTQTNG
jgi:DUF438 domain-containing protein